MDRVTVTQSELIAALQAAMEQPDDPEGAVTTAELAEQLGWHVVKVRDELGKLDRAGRLECVKVIRRDITGRVGNRPAYRLVKAIEDGDTDGAAKGNNLPPCDAQ